MTYPSGPTPRRLPVASVVAGVAVALVANAFTLGSVPALRAAWQPSSPAPAPGPATPSSFPVTASPSPSSDARPSAKASSPSAKPTNGQVKMTDALRRGIVLIEATTGDSVSAGTGMIIDPSGRVLTNYHVVRSTSTIEVVVAASERRFTARLVGRDASKDVALLQIEGGSGFATITPDTDPVEIGDRVVAAGNASGQGFLTGYSGSILAKSRNIRVKGPTADDPDENLTGLIETDAHAEPGDSGGPLFDAEAEVLGMTTAGSSTTNPGNATAFAVPFATAMGVVDKVLAGDESGTVVIGPKAWLGVTAVNASGGVRVKSVVSGSPAARAGLKEDGLLVRLDDHELGSVSDLSRALDAYEPGSTVTIRWTTAGGTSRSTEVTLTASKFN